MGVDLEGRHQSLTLFFSRIFFLYNGFVYVAFSEQAKPDSQNSLEKKTQYASQCTMIIIVMAQ